MRKYIFFYETVKIRKTFILTYQKQTLHFTKRYFIIPCQNSVHVYTGFRRELWNEYYCIFLPSFGNFGCNCGSFLNTEKEANLCMKKMQVIMKYFSFNKSNRGRGRRGGGRDSITILTKGSKDTLNLPKKNKNIKYLNIKLRNSFYGDPVTF